MKKWYSLIDKIYRKENLKLAFMQVKGNNGAPGIDGETVSNFATKLEQNIEFFYERLKTNSYEPSPVKKSRNREAGRWCKATGNSYSKGQGGITSHCKYH